MDTQNKAKLTAAVTQLLPPSVDTAMPGTTQMLEPSAANPPGAGLVTHRRTVGLTDRGCGTYVKLHNDLTLLNE